MTEKEAISILYRTLGDDVLGNIPKLTGEIFEAIRVAIRIMENHISADEERSARPIEDPRKGSK